MSSINPSRNPSHNQFTGCIISVILLSLLLVTSLACALPSIPGRATETPTVELPGFVEETAAPALSPTPTPPPLPPRLIESDPVLGAEVPLNGPITLYFNQAMDRDSVEAALAAHQELDGDFIWINDATVSINPAKLLPSEAIFQIDLGSQVRASNGLNLAEPIKLTFETAGQLRLVDKFPEPGSIEVDPTGSIIAAFNQPVLPQGAEGEVFVPAFAIEPFADGRGEWVNASTYIFHPDIALAGGTTYIVHVNPELVSTAGSSLAAVDSWTFTTSPPRVLSLEPGPGARGVRLDSPIRVEFNQPMEADSVAENFTLLSSADSPVPGELIWNENFTQFTFKPRYLLRRDLSYTVVLNGAAQALGGSSIGTPLEARWQAAPALEILGTEPLQNGLRSVTSNVSIYFNAPVQTRNVLQFITFTPDVPGLRAVLEDDGRILQLYGGFAPDTNYTLIVSPNLPDAWSGRLGEDFVLNFRTLPLEPDLVVATDQDILFVTPQSAILSAQATNLPPMSVSLGSLPLQVFTEMLSEEGYLLRQSYQPEDQHTFRPTLELVPNQSQTIEIPLSPGDEPLPPGVYRLLFNVNSERINPGPYLLVSSHVNLTFKISPTDALVWAVDLRTNTPVAGADISIFEEDGSLIATGQTDEDGVLKIDLPTPREEPYRTSMVVLGQPGDEDFGLALSTWNHGLAGENFDIQAKLIPPQLLVYLYTDRSVYRPGQLVSFRAVVRQAYYGNYAMPTEASLPDGKLPIVLQDEVGEVITTFELPLSAFGTAQGSYQIPPDTPAGVLRFSSPQVSSANLEIQVAEVRKPEFNLNVDFAGMRVLAGQTLQAQVSARYPVGAPVGNLPVKWDLYKAPFSFSLPGYVVGPSSFGLFDPQSDELPDLNGRLAAQGEATLDANGSLVLEFPTESQDRSYQFTLVVTAEERSGFPVVAQTTAEVNYEEYAIGVNPDAWLAQSGHEVGFEIKTVDWQQRPAGSYSMRAEFYKLTWEGDEPGPADSDSTTAFTPEYKLAGSTDFISGPDGVARLAFTPSDPGTYQLDVSSLMPGGEETGTQVLIWVGGPGQAEWPDLPYRRLLLIPNQDSYQPGETAQVFVPNPFKEGALGLVSVERGTMLRHRVVNLEGAGTNLYIPLGDEDAPNVYLSVTLFGKTPEGRPTYRQGYLILPVQTIEHVLDLEVTAEPEKAGPGEEVKIILRVTDASGEPVVGEFSVSMMDEDVLALGEPSAVDIQSAFFGIQPLGVDTGLPLSAHAQGLVPKFVPDEEQETTGDVPPIVVPEEITDAGFWNGEIITNEQGEAEIRITLPNDLKTWVIDVRGLTEDTRVGQAELSLVTTKDLLIHPVTPRFLVLGDHAQLSAVIYNNTGERLEAEVSLQAGGFDLDIAGEEVRNVRLPAGGWVQVDWWGNPRDVNSVELVFSARAVTSSPDEERVLEDIASPETGPLPVLRYTIPHSFTASGILERNASHQELVSLPRSFEVGSGELRVELAPSLPAALMSALDYLDKQTTGSTEQILSQILANLQIYQVLRESGLSAPALQARMERILPAGVAELLSRQNEDGGWGWWQGEESDTLITAYVVMGLHQVRTSGSPVDALAVQRAIGFLQTGLSSPDVPDELWQFDQQAFVHYVLAMTGRGDLEGISTLVEENDQLSHWSRALLALALERLSPDDLRAQEIFSNLASTAIHAADRVYWEEPHQSWQNLDSPTLANAVLLYSLAQHDPAAPLLEEAARHLMVQRTASGGWASTYETAWAILALSEVVRNMGEQAGEFNFSATLNDNPLANGSAQGQSQLTPVTATVPVSALHSDFPNKLIIKHEGDVGNLYYTARLMIDRPLSDTPAFSRGIHIWREYFIGDCTKRSKVPETGCNPVRKARAGDLITVRLTLTVADTAHFLVLQDFIPAGTEILDATWKIHRDQDAGDMSTSQSYQEGRGWWYFSQPEATQDHVTWAARVLEPGTYELTYRLVARQPGEYGVLPVQARQLYSQDLHGQSAGGVFVIEPARINP
jgi:alpha-2-macroglobulin